MDFNKFPQFNTGLKHEIRPNDWVEGTIPYQIILPSGDWRPFCPPGESQAMPQPHPTFDPLACASFSNNNLAEISLKQQGIDVNFSDRFLAKMSGTTTSGNSFGIVEDTCRKFGRVLETVWPVPDQYTWDAYYSPINSIITSQAKFFQENYEFIGTDKATLAYHLKQCPLQIALPTPIPTHGVVMVYLDGDTVYYFDSYPGTGNYLKTMSVSLVEAAMKLIIKPKIMSNAQFVHKTGTQEYGFYLPSLSEDAIKDKALNLGTNILNSDGTIAYTQAKEVSGL